jgi:hypothetical protein
LFFLFCSAKAAKRNPQKHWPFLEGVVRFNKGVYGRVLFLGPAFDAEDIGPAKRTAWRGKGQRPFPFQAKPAPTGINEAPRKHRQTKEGQRKKRGRKRKWKKDP